MDDNKDEEKRFHTVTSRWSESVEKVIKGIGESCEGYKWMNIFAAKKASTRYNYFMYTLIFIGPVSGILSTLSIADGNEDSKTIQILVTIFSFVSGVISAIIKFSKFEQKSTSHKTIAARYASLEGNVRRQLSLYRNERVNAGDYLEWVSTSFENLFSSTPLMPDDIYQEWVTFAEKNGLVIPKKLGMTIDIEVSEHVEHLAHVGEIGVNKNVSTDSSSEEQTRSVERQETSPTIDVVVQGTGTMKRNKHQRDRSVIYNSTPDLNRYTDSAMQYEMRRLYQL